MIIVVAVAFSPTPLTIRWQIAEQTLRIERTFFPQNVLSERHFLETNCLRVRAINKSHAWLQEWWEEVLARVGREASVGRQGTVKCVLAGSTLGAFSRTPHAEVQGPRVQSGLSSFPATSPILTACPLLLS